MRKYNEGYALVLVLVVLIVLALLSSVILTGAQRNLEAQVNSVDYMTAKYKAQGEVEIIVASLESLLNDGTGTVQLRNKSGENLTVKVIVESPNVKITSIYDNVQVDCTLTLSCNGIAGSEEIGYTIAEFTGISCTSYEISTIGGGT